MNIVKIDPNTVESTDIRDFGLYFNFLTDHVQTTTHENKKPRSVLPSA